MKILESKYYNPIHVIKEVQVNDVYMLTSTNFNKEAVNQKNPYSEILNRLYPCIYLGDDEMVIRTELLNDFKKCTDFTTVSYNEKNGKFYTSEACYFHPDFEFFMLTSENLSSEYDEFIIESGMFRVTEIYYNSTKISSKEDLEDFFNKYLQKYISKEAKISVLIKDKDRVIFKNQKINPYSINLNTMYNDDFSNVHNKIKTDLSDTHKGLVLLHGIAGSGKTNYIKWLTSQIPEKNFIFVPNNMIQVLTDPSFIKLLMSNKNSIIVLEDCENYIAERSLSNNKTDGVASILNITDGLLSDVLECQFICTFNAKLTEVDHALLRKGRLIAEYHFDKLSIEKCNAYLKSANKNITVDKPYSLAEIVHFEEEEFTSKKKNGNIGF